MRHRPAWATDAIDLERPAAARMCDHYLDDLHLHDLHLYGLHLHLHDLGGDVTRSSGPAAVGLRA